MSDNYDKIINNNLGRLFQNMPPDLSHRIQGMCEGQTISFLAFGKQCFVTPHGITLNEEPTYGPMGIILSLYLLHATPNSPILFPFKSFKEFPNSMPYVGAFTTHTEHILIPHVKSIEKNNQKLINMLHGQPAPSEVSGDFAMIVTPLPKIKLCYIFYHADEDFPASVTCLFSNNANKFLPMDALADVGEYTSRMIISSL